LIKTEGWKPVDTQIRISEVADLVAKLSGKELYGDRTEVPLRELLQNAVDAVHARRVIDSKDSEWGEIYVLSGEDHAGPWIEVEDSGVGMSETVLTGPFLDFGKTFWGSALMQEELPGLASKGFNSIGRYGIGFFSVFMWGERIDVVTRRFDKAREDTLVLSFKSGLRERPLLRKSKADERMPDGGTRIRVWFREKTQAGRYMVKFGGAGLSLVQFCEYIAPCVDVTIKVRRDGTALETAVSASDWITMDEEQFRTRISRGDWEQVGRSFRNAASSDCQIIKGTDGEVLGRAALSGTTEEDSYVFHEGIVTVGGFRSCGLSGISGVFAGSPVRAARDAAVPLIPYPILKEWAESQRERYVRGEYPAEVNCSVAAVLYVMGIQPNGLPIARNKDGWRTREEIARDAGLYQEFIVVSSFTVRFEVGTSNKAELYPNVLIANFGSPAILQGGRNSGVSEWPAIERDWKSDRKGVYPGTLQAAVIEALASGWQCSVSEVLEANSFEDDKTSRSRVIGTVSGRPLEVGVNVIRKPTRRTAGTTVRSGT
jgi:hypothetical protein